MISKNLEIKVFDFDVLSFNDPIGSLSVPLWDLMQQRLDAVRKSASGGSVAQMHFTDVPLQGVETGTISFSVSFELKFVVGLLPGTPVHASAAQALRRPPPKDATWLERARDQTLILLGHQIFLWIAVVWTLALCGFGAFAGITFGALFVPQIIVAAASGEPEEAIDWHAIGLADRQLEIWANICVQVLTGLFTYFNILTLPWRLSILYHMCSRRSDAPGRDFCAPAARSPPRPARCPASSDALINGRRALRPRAAQTAVRRRRFGSTSPASRARPSPPSSVPPSSSTSPRR